MRLFKDYKGVKDSEFGIGRFYRSDLRKLNALRLYYDFPPNSRELFNKALDGRHALLAVLKRGKKVIGYMLYEFPYLGKDSLWLFRIPRRITKEEFVGVSYIVMHYCTKILGATQPSKINIFNRTNTED